jgi:hypothetical protein
MNCEDLHRCVERDWQIAKVGDPQSAAMANHVAACGECRDYLEEQEELCANLWLMRESAPRIPATLDGIVLAKYRQHIRDLSYSKAHNRRPARTIALNALGWTAAAAFALIVAYGELGLFMHGEHGRTWVGRQAPEQSSMAPVQPEQVSTTTRGQTKAPHATKLKTRLGTQRSDQAKLTARKSNPLLQPTEFQSLMYCDELSCGGAMEVIRIQVPAEVLGLSSPSVPANELISADVLVGPDGIARGIRPAAQVN